MEWLDVVRENIYDIIGLLGVVFYVASYSALQFGKLDGNSINYCILNGAAATLVLVSLSKDFNLASAIIQIVWITVSIFGLYRYWKNRVAPGVGESCGVHTSRQDNRRKHRSNGRAYQPHRSDLRLSRKGTITFDS